MKMRIYPGDGGFTLIELLVVIGIISILAGLIIPFITTEPGRNCACKNNLRQIGLAIIQYSNDYGGYPWSDDPEPAATFQLLVDAGLLDDPGVFVCPSCLQKEAECEDGHFTLEPGNVSYACSAEPVAPSAPSRTMIAADACWGGEHNQGHPRSINVLYRSGSVVELRLKPGDTWEGVTKGKLKR
jgi:prepilin-type N-terminal cleavage/methylation domain-containing protein